MLDWKAYAEAIEGGYHHMVELLEKRESPYDMVTRRGESQ